eukprot:gene22961-29748_t
MRYDISPLGNMLSLAKLNLRSNELKIDAVQSICATLSKLNSLRHLYLGGNSLCSDFNDYPKVYFQSQSNLSFVDDWERDQVLHQFENLAHELHDSSILHPSVRYNEEDVIISNDSNVLRIKSLEAQIDAMNEAFKLQEKALGENGLALAQFTISNRHDLFGRGGQPPLARVAVQSASGASIGDQKGLIIESSSRKEKEKEKDVVEKFPYYLLLQSWRQQVIKCLMSKSFVDKELEIANRNMKSLRVEFLHEMQKMESNTLKWKQHGAAQAEKCELLSQQQSSLNEALLSEKKAHAETSASLQQKRKEMGSLSSFLNHFKVQMDRQHVNEQARWMQYSQQLAEQQQRLTLATERLSFISLFVAQKNVQLRNSIAALDGERRLIQWTMIRERERLEQGKTQSRLGNSNSNLSRDFEDGLGDSYTTVVPFVSEVRLSAESEGMLKAVFRRLDVDDAGSVSIRLVLNAISGTSFQISTFSGTSSSTEQETASAFLSQLSAMKKEPSLLGQLVDGDLLSPLGVFLCRSIGLNQWANFLFSLLQSFLRSDLSDEPTVTWGECLLAMVADPTDSKVAHVPIDQPGRYSALSVREMKELRELQLIGDLEWGAVPLHVPSKYQHSLEVHRGSNPSPLHSHTSVVEGGCILSRDKEKEIARLSMERRFLLNSLQQMGRSLERRAESIKGYFEGDLRKHAVKEKRLQLQLREAIEAKETMERRFQEADLAHSTSTEKLQRTLALISEENGKLRDQLGEQRTDEERRMERLLQDAAAKQVRQETELGVLQRECAKKEVRAKALQRDLLRLQSQQANHADEVFSLKDQLAMAQKQLRERDFELKSGLKSAEDVFNVERLSFNQKINELHEQLISSRQQVQVLTDQLQEQERRHSSEISPMKTESFTNTEEVLTTATALQQAAAVRDQIELIRNLQQKQQQQQQP